MRGTSIIEAFVDDEQVGVDRVADILLEIARGGVEFQKAVNRSGLAAGRFAQALGRTPRGRGERHF